LQVWKGFMAPTGRQYGRDRIDPALLCLSVIVALVALGIAVRPDRVGLSGGVEGGVGEYVGEQIRAAQIMADCISTVSDARAELGIAIDPELDPNRTGLIGRDFTPLTTTVGVLEAKRTATNPEFAALMVRYFREAGLRQGDVVAVGASGSFPSLIIATLAAARALDLEPVLIYSIGASMYGATIPQFTFIEMLAEIRARGILPYSIAAVSLGGDDDAGGGGLFEISTEVSEMVAKRSGLQVIREDSIEKSIARRMQVFEEAAALCGGSVSCFVNIGGASANYGTTAASLDFPNGLVMVPKVMSFDPARGLMFEYAAMGLPVVNLIDIRGIAMRNGIPVDPVPLPNPGDGRVYSAHGHSKPAAVSGLVACLVVCLGASKKKPLKLGN
jgi:poly-gamma-glutamate system protein